MAPGEDEPFIALGEQLFSELRGALNVFAPCRRGLRFLIGELARP